MSNIAGQNRDKSSHWDDLYKVAESQAGYFTTRQAAEVGIGRTLLHHHVRDDGSLTHVERGLYRFRRFPPSEYEAQMARWLSQGQRIGAVISHESAAELHDLTDLIPRHLHMIAAREHRSQPPRSGVKLHFVNGGVAAEETVVRAGMPVTDVERTILDLLASHGQTEQTEQAIKQGLNRGLTTERRLRQRAARRTKANQARLDRALALVGAGVRREKLDELTRLSEELEGGYR